MNGPELSSMMNTANQSFDKTLQLIQFYTDLLMYHQTKFGRKRLSCSEDIIWTKPGQADTRYYLGKTWTGRHTMIPVISPPPPSPTTKLCCRGWGGGYKKIFLKHKINKTTHPRGKFKKRKKAHLLFRCTCSAVNSGLIWPREQR